MLSLYSLLYVFGIAEREILGGQVAVRHRDKRGQHLRGCSPEPAQFDEELQAGIVDHDRAADR